MIPDSTPTQPVTEPQDARALDLRHLRNARTALMMFLGGRSPKELAPNERAYYADLPERLREMQGEIERLQLAAVSAREPGAEEKRLRAVIERDRTRAHVWIERLRAVLASYAWLKDGRGSYAWDDERYKSEFAVMHADLDRALTKAETELHVRDLSDCPETQAEAEAALAAAPQAETRSAVLCDLLADEHVPPISAGVWDAAIAAFERNKLRAEIRKALAAAPVAGAALDDRLTKRIEHAEKLAERDLTGPHSMLDWFRETITEQRDIIRALAAAPVAGAREVGLPPLPGPTPDTYAKPAHGWTCFHCGETFKTLGGARDHFGAKPDAMPGCLIRVQPGDERGLVMALRTAEAEIERLKAAAAAPSAVLLDETRKKWRMRIALGIFHRDADTNYTEWDDLGDHSKERFLCLADAALDVVAAALASRVEPEAEAQRACTWAFSSKRKGWECSTHDAFLPGYVIESKHTKCAVALKAAEGNWNG